MYIMCQLPFYYLNAGQLYSRPPPSVGLQFCTSVGSSHLEVWTASIGLFDLSELSVQSLCNLSSLPPPPPIRWQNSALQNQKKSVMAQHQRVTKTLSIGVSYWAIGWGLAYGAGGFHLLQVLPKRHLFSRCLKVDVKKQDLKDLQMHIICEKKQQN